MFQKNLHPFNFCNTFFIREPIFIIFDNNMREKKSNKTYIVFPTTPNLYYYYYYYYGNRTQGTVVNTQKNTIK